MLLNIYLLTYLLTLTDSANRRQCST